MSEEKREYTGGNVTYYSVEITDPKRYDPYTAECEDIIESLGMTFAEGCAFKAIWRRCAARTLNMSKAGYKGGKYDAEKTVYYGQRMVAQDLRQEGKMTGVKTALVEKLESTTQETPAPAPKHVTFAMHYDIVNDTYAFHIPGRQLKDVADALNVPGLVVAFVGNENYDYPMVTIT